MTVYINGVAQVGGDVGGLYGMNVETLAGDKTLTVGTDEIYQYLDEGGVNRAINLSNTGAVAGDRFVIRHNGAWNDTHVLSVNRPGPVNIDGIWSGAIKEFIFDGTLWISGSHGTGETDNKRNAISIGLNADGSSGGLAIGRNSDGHDGGVAVGLSADGYDDGVGIGDTSSGHTQGVAVGRAAQGDNRGVALGCLTETNAKFCSIALGFYSECERTGETSTNINGGDGDQENNVVQGRWERELAGGAGATEIFCAGQFNQRFLVRANSVLAFTMIIVARDNVANEVARYSVHDGLIKRDGADNTAMVLCTVTVDHEDDGAWDCAVTADDGNEALIITVTGDGANITQWAAVMDGVETHF